MPVTVVIGGQYGSEGKGKVAQYLAREQQAKAAVRVGGSNSGHTTIATDGERRILRQLPTAAVLPDVLCVLPAGSYIDVAVLMRELDELDLPADRLLIDPNAVVITQSDKHTEAKSGLGARIGSTCSGTGAAVVRRLERRSSELLAEAHPALKRYVGRTTPVLRDLLNADERVVVEGTQGHGLSVLHAPHYPKVTSRDTSAAGAISEAGLSPFDVDDVVLVLRAHPIRVAGDSGPFDAQEIDWSTVASEGGHAGILSEFTSVTGRLRRVARFDPGIVREAIAVNRPSMIVLNHIDYVDAAAADGELTARAEAFISSIAGQIGEQIHLVGIGPDQLVRCGTREVATI